MLTIPERLQKLKVVRPDGITFDLVYDDSYESTAHKERPSSECKEIGMFKENAVMERCWEYNWMPSRDAIGEGSEADVILLNKYNSLIALPCQIRSLSYKANHGRYSLNITHTKNGNKRAHFDPRKVPFMLVWSPYKYDVTGGSRRAVYIIPTEDTLAFKHMMGVNPLNPDNAYNKYLEAWDLLDNFLDVHCLKLSLA